MDKRQLVNDMKAHTKAGFITRQGLSEYMGIDNPRNVDKYLHGLERVNGKYYFIADVATALKDAAVM